MRISEFFSELIRSDGTITGTVERHTCCLSGLNTLSERFVAILSNKNHPTYNVRTITTSSRRKGEKCCKMIKSIDALFTVTSLIIYSFDLVNYKLLIAM